MALIKCPECGKEVSDSAKTCPNCGYPIAKTVAAQEKTTVSKKSKWSKIILWFVIVYGILTAIFLWALYQSDWSASAVKSIISNGNFSCLFSHTFEEPNCVHGKLCTKCGYETGDLTPHTWVDATCTKPKTCSVCGKQSGKELGHSTRLGKCSTCGELVAELLPKLVTITNYYEKASDEIGYAVPYFMQYKNYVSFDDDYNARRFFDLGKGKLVDAKNSLKSAVQTCGDYSEFAEVKKNLEKAYNAMNTSSRDVQILTSNAEKCVRHILEVHKSAQKLIPEGVN